MGARRLALVAILVGTACSFRIAPGMASDDGGSGDGSVPPDWWSPDYLYRRRITVTTATAAADATYSVMFVADTMALRAEGKVSSTSDDWRIVHHTAPDQWDELDRWIDDARGGGWNSTDTQTWFALPVRLVANSSDDETYVYYGAPAATPPPSDLDRVFLFGDDFEDGLGKWTNNNLGEQITLDAVRAGGAASFKIITGGAAAAGAHHDIALPATPMMWSHSVRQAQANQSFSFARSFDCVYAARTPPTFVDPHLRLATELDSSDKMEIWTSPLDNWSIPVTTNAWHQVDTVFDGAANMVTARFDGSAWHTPPSTWPYYYLQGTPSKAVALEGEGGQNGSFWVDNYVIRRYVAPEPTTLLGPETSLPQ